MVWFNVDDTLAFHRKALQAGNAAMGLWVRAGAWSAGTLTDGFIPKAIARSMGTPTQVRSLVNAQLWIEIPQGYQFHEWGQRNRSKEEVESKRESDRKRKADQRKARNVPQGQRPDVPPDFHPDVAPESEPESHEESPPESEWESTPPFLSTPRHAVSSADDVGGEGYVADARESAPLPESPSNVTPLRRPLGPQPAPRCDRHLNAAIPPPCGACKEQRLALEDWTVRRAAQDRAAHDAKFAAVEACEYCDQYGRMTPPDELDGEPLERCDHTGLLPERWQLLLDERHAAGGAS